MRDEIIEELSRISEEEQFILIEKNPDDRSLYARSGRFIIERRHISSISFGEATAALCLRRHPRFRPFPLHSHDYIEMMYVCNGSITHIINGEEITLSKDDIILLGKDTRHAIKEAGKEDIGVNFIVSLDLFEGLYHSMKKSSQLSSAKIEGITDKGTLPFCVFSAKDRTDIKNITESMISSALCEGNINGYILMQSLSLLISYLANTEQNTMEDDNTYKENTKKRILNYIKTSYSSATLTEAAEMLGLSPSYLSRLTRNYFGSSFKELLMLERFNAACLMLTSTSIPIGDIINTVGYENSSYFHKEFKKRYGQTPSNYRRNH